MTSPAAVMNQDQAASYLGVSPRTMEQWRLRGGGPSFVRIGPRCIRYRQAALDSWLMAREVTSAAPPDI